MVVPASKVRTLCSSSEVALVRASRKGGLEVIDQAQVKRYAVQARKLFDKYQDLGRSQSRTKSRQVGFGDAAANTQLKAQIFREALESFEARLAKLGPASASPAKKSKPKVTKDRAAEHRSDRAAVRKGMNAVESLLNTRKRKKKAT